MKSYQISYFYISYQNSLSVMCHGVSSESAPWQHNTCTCIFFRNKGKSALLCMGIQPQDPYGSDRLAKKLILKTFFFNFFFAKMSSKYGIPHMVYSLPVVCDRPGEGGGGGILPKGTDRSVPLGKMRNAHPGSLPIWRWKIWPMWVPDLGRSSKFSHTIPSHNNKLHINLQICSP